MVSTPFAPSSPMVLGFLFDPLPRLAIEDAAQNRQRRTEDLDVVQRLEMTEGHGRFATAEGGHFCGQISALRPFLKKKNIYRWYDRKIGV